MNLLSKIVLLFALLIMGLWSLKLIIPVLRIDGYSGCILEKFYPGSTIYAAGYSHNRFLEIKTGMSDKEVLHILGQPIERWADGNVIKYAYTKSDGHYRIRQIDILNGKVVEIRGYYYLD